mgnify:CR=1 FL=1
MFLNLLCLYCVCEWYHNISDMQASETLVLKIDKAKKQAFLEMLKWLDFVEVQSPDSVLQRFLKDAPKNVPLTYEDVAEEIMAHRYSES